MSPGTFLAWLLAWITGACVGAGVLVSVWTDPDVGTGGALILTGVVAAVFAMVAFAVERVR